MVGLVAAIAIGIAVVWIVNTAWTAFSETGGSLWGGETDSQVLMVSAPFLVLALLGTGAPWPWLVGLFLTAAFWGFCLYVLTRPYEGGGANIGLGVLMLFSPFLITIAVLLARPILSSEPEGTEGN